MKTAQSNEVGVAAAKRGFRPLNVCLVSTEIIGPFRNGGVATANTGLAQFLQSLGHTVTVLYCNVWDNKPYVLDLDFDHWVEYYRKQGITLLALHTPDYVHNTSRNRARSFAVNAFLEEHSFDLVFTDDLYGLCFYSLQAKRAGIAFNRTLFVLTVHSPNIWLSALNETPYETLEHLLLVDQEIYCIEHADYVIGPSKYLLDWLRDRGVRPPSKTIVQQYVLPHETQSSVNSSALVKRRGKDARVDEIVFFGRLETRKGLVLFCDMVDRLSQKFPDIKITFLGKYDSILGEHAGSYVVRRSVKWPNPLRILTDCNTQEALKYLLRGNRLAVMPSLEDNLPCAVMECILNGVAFVTTGSGGIHELIAPADLENCVGGRSAERLADLCGKAIESGIKPPRFAMEQNEIRKRLSDFIRSLADEVTTLSQRQRQPSTADTTEGPLVSVCVTHYNQGWFLPQQLAAIAKQTYRNFEVIVVDDGSTDPFSQATLARMENTYAALGWKFIRQANSHLGAARNAAAKEARGKYLIFMDDDNVALPHELETFVAAAEHTGAEIVSCLSYMTHDVATPSVDQCYIDYYPMGGASRSGGLITNVFADANSLFRREAFQALGGFAEKRGFACHDWKIFAAAKVAGMTHLVLPRPLFIYRLRWGGMFMRSSDVESRREIFKVYASQALGEVAGAFELLTDGKKDERQSYFREYLNTLEHGEKLIELSFLPFHNWSSEQAHKLLFEYMVLHNRLDNAMQYASDHEIDQDFAVATIRENAWSAQVRTRLDEAEARDERNGFISMPSQVLQSAIQCGTSAGRSTLVERVGDGVMVRPIKGRINRVLLPRACPAATAGLTIDAEIQGAACVEVGVLLLDPDMRDVVFHDELFAKALDAATWSGSSNTNGRSRKWSINLSRVAWDRPRDVILAVRSPAHSNTQRTGELVFSSLRVVSNDSASDHESGPRPEAPRQVLRLPRQVLERFMQLHSATANFSKLYLDGKGLRLSPTDSGWNLAICREAIPGISTRVSATVSLEQAPASPVEFALWVGRLEEIELYSEPNMQSVHGARGWSGWKRVEERGKPFRVEAALAGRTAASDSLDLFIATRPVQTKLQHHCEAYFRSFEVEVDGSPSK
jgi:glycosyltransferase involved in cell wall biosynthesis